MRDTATMTNSAVSEKAVWRMAAVFHQTGALRGGSIGVEGEKTMTSPTVTSAAASERMAAAGDGEKLEAGARGALWASMLSRIGCRTVSAMVVQLVGRVAVSRHPTRGHRIATGEPAPRESRAKCPCHGAQHPRRRRS